MSAPERLRPRSAVCLVIANMIGAGVFTSSGFALADHPPWIVLLAWLVGGVLATCGALCYGALGRRFPRSGGEYELLRATVHPIAGYLAGVVSLVAGFSAPIAIAAATFEIYLRNAFGIEAPAHALGAGVIVVAAVLHAIGLNTGARAQDALVVFKLALIAVLVVAGVGALAAKGMPPPSVGLPESFDPVPFAVTCVWVSFAYSGWNAASYLAGELVDARRTLTRVLLTGTWITAAAYLALNAVFVFAAPRAELAGQMEIGVIAARSLGGANAAMALAALVALAGVTSVTAMTMAGPRVYARMAEDGFLPRAIATSRGHRAAIALQVVLALAMLWSLPFQDLMTWTGWTLWASSAATIAGLVRVRLREGALAVPVPGWPWVPALYLVVSLSIGAFSFERDRAAGGAVLGALGVAALLYFALPGSRRARGSSSS